MSQAKWRHGSATDRSRHLVLVEGVGDVIGHVACGVGQHDHHVGAGGVGGSQPLRLGLHEGGQSVPAQLILHLRQARCHLTGFNEVRMGEGTWLAQVARRIRLGF